MQSITSPWGRTRVTRGSDEDTMWCQQGVFATPSQHSWHIPFLPNVSQGVSLPSGRQSLTIGKKFNHILKIHSGLISRNEMAQEWKHHWHVANARWATTRARPGWWRVQRLRPRHHRGRARRCYMTHRKKPFWQWPLAELLELLVSGSVDIRCQGWISKHLPAWGCTMHKPEVLCILDL